MTNSLLGGSTAPVTSRGRVKITFARIEKNGKQLPGSCSVPVQDSTPQETRDYVIRACDRDASLETIAEQAGMTVEEVLSYAQNELAPAEETAETAEETAETAEA